MPIRRLKKFLDEYRVKHVVMSHSTAYTAQEVAESSHISGKEFAKTVIVKVKGRMVMVVVPAPDHIDFNSLTELMETKDIELASEEEFKSRFPDCEIGAMPPFGNLYGMDVLVDRSLEANENIVFNAGNHRELIKMRFNDFDNLVEPKLLEIVTLSYY